MERHLPADNKAPHFLPMMVRALARGGSGGELSGPLPLVIQVAAEGPRTVVEAGLPVADAHEQMANPGFATRSTARGARTIITRKSST